jgi:hypothetical protein
MNYYKIKAAALERQMRLAQLNAEAAKADATFAAVLEAEGLDPAQQYTLKDADESVTPVESEANDGA